MAQPDRDLSAPNPITFGRHFTPSMLTALYDPATGWDRITIAERRPLELDPATMALHYGQAVFEGLMAHRQADGTWALFRARDYAERLARSCERMAIPPMPVDELLNLWVRFARHEVVSLPEHCSSLYLRPLIFGCDVRFGDRPSSRYLMCILGVLADPNPRRRLDVLITDQFVRAASGGVGCAKVPGNYGAGMLARQVAEAHGCDQVLWLDAGRRRWVEELGSMNVAFVISDVLVTPPLTDTILCGVTRGTILTLAREAGIECEERPIALEEITAAMAWQGLTEAMGFGTAIGISSIASFRVGERRLELPESTPIADRLRQLLADHRHGRAIDSRGWLTPL